jgi:DNA-binding FadR family transcriptional regulator
MHRKPGSVTEQKKEARQANAVPAGSGATDYLGHALECIVPSPDTQSTYLAWLQIREQLEAIGAREAAQHVTAHDIAQLRALFRPYSRKGFIAQHELADYAEIDLRFHQQIVQLSGNPALQRLWALFGHEQMQMVKANTIESPDRAQVSLRDHLTIIDALESADAETCASLCKEHIRALYDHIRHGLQ